MIHVYVDPGLGVVAPGALVVVVSSRRIVTYEAIAVWIVDKDAAVPTARSVTIGTLPRPVARRCHVTAYAILQLAVVHYHVGPVVGVVTGGTGRAVVSGW